MGTGNAFQHDSQQGFMQGEIIARHTRFGGHMGVNSLQIFNVSDDLKRTTNTHVTPFTLTFEA